ncbi:MAG: UvrD-helicase domain-containing protein [Gemmatimonadota bacterium]
MAMQDSRWTDEQADAITAEGHVLLSASAGTGKTTTIVGKILWLLGLPVGVRRSTGEPLPPCPEPVDLGRIAAITFTEKAATDLKDKLRREIEDSERGRELRWEIDRASVGTIHGFCGELLRDHALRLGIDPTFRVLDERETRLRLDEIIRDLLLEAVTADEPGAVDFVKRYRMSGWEHRAGAVDHVREVLRDIRWHAHRWENWTSDGAVDVRKISALATAAGIGPGADDAGVESGGGLAEADVPSVADAAVLYDLAHRALGRWLGWLEEENLRDFDSLILDARRLLTREETRPALASIRARHRILIIDEFQDTDDAQREIAFAIAGLGDAAPAEASGPELFLVGDPKQSIYRFRGADIGVWNTVREILDREGRLLRLTHNFRSEPAVVDLVNRACGAAMEERGRALEEEIPRSRVEYEPLTAAIDPVPGAGGTEWLAVDGGANEEERARAEGRLIASRINRLVRGGVVRDPESGRGRPCTLRDIAILVRKRKGLDVLELALREAGVRTYNASTAGLSDRQEIVDLVTALRLIENPRDELRAFAFLRSPFVGLRDEVLARIRLDPGSGSTDYLRQAERFLAAVDAPAAADGAAEGEGAAPFFPAPESPLIAAIERQALADGLAAIRDAHALLDRADASELLEDLLERTGYRLHLLLRADAAEALANVERFFGLLDDYRHLPLAHFLDLWDRWGDQDSGIPQAPLFSHADDVVTLSTVHAAKGLEWPVVILAGAGRGIGVSKGGFRADPELGPAFLPNKDDRGPRSRRLQDREALEDRAEEARVLYVAATRARDRFIVAGPTAKPKGFAAWLAPLLDGAVEEHEAPDDRTPAEELRPATGPASASEDDETTGTGRQIDAFGFDHEAEDEDGQFHLFAAPAPGDGTDREGADEGGRIAGRIEPAVPPMVIYREADPIQGTLAQAPVSLAWLEGIEAGPWPDLVKPIRLPERSFTTSATELRLRALRPDEWSLRYEHGVEPAWSFAPRPPGPEADPEIPALVRGTLIHGVLERIEEAEELERILNETIAGLDGVELETLLSPGTAYRRALEEEIERVVRGDEWRWYVSGEHDRELPFVHLAGPRTWRLGAFDLFRPARPSGPEAGPGAAGAAGTRDAERDSATWIIDFKTHRVEAAEADGIAKEYEIQGRVYREAASALLGPGADVRVALHFTHPNVVVELPFRDEPMVPEEDPTRGRKPFRGADRSNATQSTKPGGAGP